MLDFLYFCTDMLTKTQALVLKMVKYGDNKFIIDLFTEELGRVSVMASISNSPKARFRRSFFQPLTLLDIEIDVRQTRSLQSLKSASLAFPYSSMMTDPSKMCIVMFLSEFLCAVTRDEQRNTLLYNYIRSSFEWLDGKEEHISNFHLVFMMRLAKFVGFSPNVEDYTDGCCFDLRSGTFCMSNPFHPDVLLPNDASKMLTLLRMNYENMHLFKMSRQERNQLLDVLLKYYGIHVPSFPEMHTLDVLRELF